MIPSYPPTLSHICVLHKPRDKLGSKGWLLPKVFCLLCHGTVLIVSEYFCVAGNMDEYTSLYQHEPSIHRGLTYLVILCNSERVFSLQKIRNNFECACTDCFMYKQWGHLSLYVQQHTQCIYYIRGWAVNSWRSLYFEHLDLQLEVHCVHVCRSPTAPKKGGLWLLSPTALGHFLFTFACQCALYICSKKLI